MIPATGFSPRFSTRTRHRRPTWPPPTTSGGRSSGPRQKLKTHQRGPWTVLRSKSPDLVLQEIWGHLCCHYAIRTLMVQAPHTPDTTLTGSASSPPYGSPEPPSPTRAIFPP
jgi:hypothetical protein